MPTEHSIRGGIVIVANGGKHAVYIRDQKGTSDNLIAESVAEVFESIEDSPAESQARNYAERVPPVFDSDKQRKGFKAEAEKAHAHEMKLESERRESKRKQSESEGSKQRAEL